MLKKSLLAKLSLLCQLSSAKSPLRLALQTLASRNSPDHFDARRKYLQVDGTTAIAITSDRA